MENKAEKRKSRILPLILMMIVAFGLGAFFIAAKLQPDKFGGLFQKPVVEYTQDLGTFTFNVNEKRAYGQLNITVGYSNEKKAEQVVMKVPAMQDTIISTLVNISRDELLNAENLQKNKEILLEKINSKFEEPIVENLYITDLKVGS